MHPLLIVGLVVFGVVIFNILLFLSVKRRGSNHQTEIISSLINIAKDPFGKTDQQLDELAKLVRPDEHNSPANDASKTDTPNQP